MIELASAVVGDIDHVHTVRQRQLGVLRGGNAFQYQGNRKLLFKPRDIAPGKLRLKLAPRYVGTADVAFGEVALAPAVESGIHGEAKRPAASSDGALGNGVDPVGVAMDVELENTQRPGCCLGHAFEARFANRALHVCDPELLRRLDGSGASFGRKIFKAANGGKDDRQTQRAPQELGRRIDMAHVAQHSWPKGDRIERKPIPPDRRFGFGSADDVVPVVLIEFLARLLDQFVER